MAAGKSEPEFTRMMGFVSQALSIPVHFHKYEDRRKCPKCGELLWKTDKKPDYGFGFEWYCEVKNADQRLDYDDITTTQRRELDLKGGWIAVYIGTGRAPDGRWAYMIPWDEFSRYELHSLKQSINQAELASSFDKYALKWGGYLFGFMIPVRHPFWDWLAMFAKGLLAIADSLSAGR